MFLILIDAHSKWIEAYETASAMSTVAMQELTTTFATFGLPETIVTDNGTCLSVQSLKNFFIKMAFNMLPQHCIIQLLMC